MINQCKSIFLSVGLLTVSACSVTPKQISSDEVLAFAKADKEKIFSVQQDVSQPLGLGDVMARALRYNLEYRTKLLNQAIVYKQFELSKYDTLPSLAAEAGYVSRNNLNASRSVSVFTENETLEPSTSQDKSLRNSNVRFSWSVLDFGVSYLSAKQQADQYLIGEMGRKKVMLNMLQQVQTAYWNALIAQDMMKPTEKALRDARISLAEVNEGLSENAYPNPVGALQLKKQLLTSINELELILQVLNNEKYKLALLINLPRNQSFTLKPFDFPKKINIKSYSIDDLELTALKNSTDFNEQLYQLNVDKVEAKKAILKMFPGIDFSTSYFYDSNSYTYNNDWTNLSAKVSWNLLRLFSVPKILKTSELREEVAEKKRLAIMMGVITQLNLALNELKHSELNQTRAQEIKTIDDEIVRLTNNRKKVSSGMLSDIQAQINALRTKMNYLKANASLHESKSILFTSLGLVPVPNKHDMFALDKLANMIEGNLSQWYSGNLPIYSTTTADTEEKEINALLVKEL